MVLSGDERFRFNAIGILFHRLDDSCLVRYLSRYDMGGVKEHIQGMHQVAITVMVRLSNGVFMTYVRVRVPRGCMWLEANKMTGVY